MTGFVQGKWAQALSSTSVSVTLDSTPVEGNLLIAVVTSNSGIGSNPVHPWGLSGADVIGGTGPVAHIYSKIAGPSESTTVTHSSGTVRNYSISVIEVAPTSGRTWAGLDVSAVNTGTSVSSLALGPTGTQADTDDIAVSGIGLNGAPATVPAWNSSYTTVGSPTTDARGFMGYKILSSTAATSTTGSWTTARNAAGALATYKQITPLPPTGFIGLL